MPTLFDEAESGQAGFGSLGQVLSQLATRSTALTDSLQNLSDSAQKAQSSLGDGGMLARLAVINAERLRLSESLHADIAAIERASADKILAIRQEAAQKEQTLLNRQQSALAEADSKAEAQRAKATQAYQDRLATIEDQYRLKRLTITRQYRTSLANAIGNLDVLGAYLARQRRDEELQEAEAHYHAQRAEAQRNYERQLADITRNLELQRERIRQHYAEQLRILQTQTAQAIQLEQNRARAEIAERVNAYQAQLAALQNFSQTSVAQLTTWREQGVAQVAGFVTSALAWLSQLAVNAAGGGSGDSSGSGESPSPKGGFRENISHLNRLNTAPNFSRSLTPVRSSGHQYHLHIQNAPVFHTTDRRALIEAATAHTLRLMNDLADDIARLENSR
jgi:hypothetical protein